MPIENSEAGIRVHNSQNNVDTSDQVKHLSNRLVRLEQRFFDMDERLEGLEKKNPERCKHCMQHTCPIVKAIQSIKEVKK